MIRAAIAFHSVWPFLEAIAALLPGRFRSIDDQRGVPTMQRARVGFISAAIIAIAVVGLAFLVAPHACEWGFGLYFWCGCVALLVLLALPFVAPVGRSLVARFSWSLGFAVLGATAWLVGLLSANVRFICGLGYL